MFVDPSGRRRTVVRRIAVGACAVVVGYGILLTAALFGAPTLPSALIPAPPPAPSATTGAPSETTSSGPRPTSSRPGSTDSPATGRAPVDTSAGRTPPVNPVPTGATPPGLTSTSSPGIDRRNSRAPDVPPGQTKTAPPGNGH
ncbi:hypothetical protein [Amycolatopsis japonica]|uniref:hypothetical protein n=1 Tax=Amycolatopsis japonica TaxID=208439 RepID=UPI003788B4F9